MWCQRYHSGPFTPVVACGQYEKGSRVERGEIIYRAGGDSGLTGGTWDNHFLKSSNNFVLFS